MTTDDTFEVDLNELTDLPDIVLSGSSSSNESEPKDDCDSDDFDKKKRTKQEITRNSERKRRNRLKSQLWELKELLFRNENASKITREAILDKAITELHNLQTEVMRLKAEKEKEISGEPMMMNFFNYSDDELKFAFQFIMTKEISHFLNFNSERTIDTYLKTVSTLYQIAEKLNKAFYFIHASLAEGLQYDILQFNPKQHKKLLDKVYRYHKAHSEEEDANFEICGHSITDTLVQVESKYYSSIGDFKSSLKLRNSTLHKDPRKTFFIHGERFMLGDKISFNEVIDLKLSGDPVCESLGEVLASTAMIQNGDKENGLERMKEAISGISRKMGDSADICFSPFLLEGYLSCGLIEEGLRVVDYFLQKYQVVKIETITGIGELYRLKAEFLFALVLKQQTKHCIVEKLTPVIVQIKELLTDAYQICEEREDRMTQLRCVVTLGKVTRCFGSSLEKLEVARKIVNLLKKFVITQEYANAFYFRYAKVLIEELASS